MPPPFALLQRVRPSPCHPGFPLKAEAAAQYKATFNPVWEPRYLVCPGGAALPHILLNIATLTSGGVTGILAK